MAWIVEVYTLIEPEEVEVFDTIEEAQAEADQVNLMQPGEMVRNVAVVVELCPPPER